MKHIKRIIVFLIMAILAAALAVSAFAQAPGSNIRILEESYPPDMIEFYYGGTGSWQEATGSWQRFGFPLWCDQVTGNPAYCLESHLSGPYSTDYSQVMEDAYADGATRAGVRAILLHSASGCDGLTESQARYATQYALWSWMYESAGIGYSYFAPENLRAISGYEAVLDYVVYLLEIARYNEPLDLGISTTPAVIEEAFGRRCFWVVSGREAS